MGAPMIVQISYKPQIAAPINLPRGHAEELIVRNLVDYVCHEETTRSRLAVG